jgi:CubicO group peptidase (beta-lactamase class C family)
MTSPADNPVHVLATVLLAAALFPVSAVAQNPPAVNEIDTVFSWATPDAPGCVVAVSQHGRPLVKRAYGAADLERNVPLTPDTIFDVGSVVKQFVAASTLLLVQEGRLSLAEDIRTYIPELPDYRQRITLDHLLTHTSGVRDWTGLGPLTGRQVDALTLTLRQRRLDFAPGEEWSYSNGGYVLLKEIVARRSGMSFAEFTRNRLFMPLGMKATAYLGDGRDLQNLALAYEKAGNGWREDVLQGNARGGGGALFSTAGDLLIWNDALTNGRLGTFVTERIQTPATLSNGRALGYARGLYLDTNHRGRKVVWHSGGSGGYSSLLARFPEDGLSLAIVCNAGDAVETTMFARRIYDLLVPAPPAADAAAKPPATSVAPAGVATLDLKGKEGLYFNERTGQPLRLGVENGRLRILGGPALDAVSGDRFRNPRGVLSLMSQDQFELHFVSRDVVELTSMEGQTTRYRRAQSYAPTATDLQAFAGRYENDETRAIFDIAPGDGALTVRLNTVPGASLEFRPVDRDTFQMRGMMVRFRRDKAGRVVGLDYSNPVVRNVEFARLSN